MVNIIVISWEEAQDDHPTGKWIVIGSTIETWDGTVSNEELGKRLSEVESTKPVEVISLMPSSMVNTRWHHEATTDPRKFNTRNC